MYCTCVCVHISLYLTLLHSTYIHMYMCTVHTYACTYMYVLCICGEYCQFNDHHSNAISSSISTFSWADGATQMNHINASFDQECAAVVLARMAVLRYVWT